MAQPMYTSLYWIRLNPEQKKRFFFFCSRFSFLLQFIYYILRRTVFFFREIIPIFMDHVGYIYTVTYAKY